MVTIMQNDYLEHSSGNWKKHKYFKKIGEGANAVYKYAKNTAGKVTGDYYDSQANKHQKDADFYNHEANRHFDLAVKDAAKERTPEEEAKYDEYWRNHQRMMDANFDRQQVSEKAARDARYKADHSIGEKITGKRSKARMEKYAKGEYKGDDWRYASEKKKYDKTLAGKAEKAEKTAKSAMNKAKERVRKAKESTKTKATVTDTKTGKKRSVDPNDKLYQALEKEAKKSGGFKTRIKFKHDGMDDYAATADYGQALLDEMLGR